MKKLFYLVLVALLMVACTPSQKKKAEALIQESLKTSLYKPDTYKPVETKVDSAFAPYDDPEFFEEFAELIKINNEYQDLEEKAKDEKSSMSLWSGPYMTEYGRNNFQEAKANYEEVNAKMEKLWEKGKKQYEKVANMLQVSRKFVGYKALHNFRADNNAGNTLIGNTLFFIDKDFEKITYSMEIEEYNQLQEAINQFEEQLGEERLEQ